MHHQWARQEFSPVRLSACKASILLRKTARAVVRRARRTLFAPRLREVRVRPKGNGATKKPQHSLRLFLVHHRGLSRGLRNAALWRSLRHLRAAALFEYLRRCTRSCLLKIEQQKKRPTLSCKAFFGAPSGTRTQDPLIKSQLLYQLS